MSDLDPRAYDWYMEPSQEVVVAVFAFGGGVGEPHLAAIGRQLAEEYAATLRLHQSFVTVPHVITVSDREPGVDTSRVRSAFAVFHSLPETTLVRSTARQAGARLAVTGRLVGDRDSFHLGANMLDVERGVLLGCTQVTVPRDRLMDAVVDTSVHLLRRFEETPALALAERAYDVVGTSVYRAFYNWSMAQDLDRRVASNQARFDGRRLVEHLGYALKEDPHYLHPLRRLVSLIERAEGAEDASEADNERVWKQVCRSLETVPVSRPAIGLVHAEALRRLGELERARDVLKDVVTRHPNAAQAYYLLGELEVGVRPKMARTYFEQAHLLEPRRALYKRRLDEQ